MSHEMSFAQALTEARQIIVQQSNRIKADLDRIKSMQETIAGHTTTLAENDRTIRQRSVELERACDQLRTMGSELDDTRVAKEQAEAVVDRQGQRISQMQEALAGLEEQVADQLRRIDEMTEELDGVRLQLPTQEDKDALGALTHLLAAKKGGGPVVAKPIDSTEITAVAA